MEKIVISAAGPDLQANVEPRFGRAPYLLLINPETMEFEALTPQQNLKATQGNGTRAAALVAQCKPAALLTGYCGPKVYRTLLAAGVPVFLGVAGQVKDAVQQFLAGKLTIARGPNALAHWG
jgi:predicted Fe-Mo cluster-binding NifX family protein